jgi:hypothetical protein
VTDSDANKQNKIACFDKADQNKPCYDQFKFALVILYKTNQPFPYPFKQYRGAFFSGNHQLNSLYHYSEVPIPFMI